MIDVHCHLNLHAFDEDYEEVTKRAFESGVKTIINTGTSIPSSKRAIEIAKQFNNVYTIVGVHPHHADKADKEFEGELQNDWFSKLEELAKNPKVVGIGEIGLDYYAYKSNGIVDPALQKDAFIKQLELAHKLNLPVQIHNRHAGEDIVKILKENSNLLRKIPGMFHCFAASREVLNDVLDMGFYIGFDGNISYKGLAPGETVELPELVRLTPLERIVTETDSPFLAPIPHRGKRNEPKYVIIVGEIIAKIKGVAFEEVKEKTTQNAQTVFNLSPNR